MDIQTLALSLALAKKTGSSPADGVLSVLYDSASRQMAFANVNFTGRTLWTAPKQYSASDKLAQAMQGTDSLGKDIYRYMLVDKTVAGYTNNQAAAVILSMYDSSTLRGIIVRYRDSEYQAALCASWLDGGAAAGDAYELTIHENKFWEGNAPGSATVVTAASAVSKADQIASSLIGSRTLPAGNVFLFTLIEKAAADVAANQLVMFVYSPNAAQRKAMAVRRKNDGYLEIVETGSSYDTAVAAGDKFIQQAII
ncbi:MAG: hypothetical protein IK099_09465 [Clostridia bacterium]|nr:hypothetical protein [Clostridia bacterium]